MAKKSWPQSEVELARPLVTWLKDQHWEVYQEVQLYRGDSRADIVAVQDKITWVVECKRSMCLTLLDQATEWKNKAHYVSVAIPAVRRGRWRMSSAAFLYMKHAGIGELQVRNYHKNFEVEETVEPVLNRVCRVENLLKSLCEQQKTYAEAGNAQSSFWSPFKETCKNIRDYVEKHPGASLKEVVENVKTHYRSTKSARSVLAHWFRRGIIPKVVARVEDRKTRLYLEVSDAPDPSRSAVSNQ